MPSSKLAYMGMGIIAISLSWLFLVTSTAYVSSCADGTGNGFYCNASPSIPSMFGALIGIIAGTALISAFPSKIFITKKAALLTGILMIIDSILFAPVIFVAQVDLCSPRDPNQWVCIFNPWFYLCADATLLLGGIAYIVVSRRLTRRLMRKELIAPATEPKRV
jgi:hypothetical protein